MTRAADELDVDEVTIAQVYGVADALVEYDEELDPDVVDRPAFRIAAEVLHR